MQGCRAVGAATLTVSDCDRPFEIKKDHHREQLDVVVTDLEQFHPDVLLAPALQKCASNHPDSPTTRKDHSSSGKAGKYRIRRTGSTRTVTLRCKSWLARAAQRPFVAVVAPLTVFPRAKVKSAEDSIVNDLALIRVVTTHSRVSAV